MKYTPKDVMDYVREEDIKFVRLAFCDVFGRQRNIAVMASELPRAFEYGIAIDGSAIDGFGMSVRSDLLLHPDPGTLSQLPWRPQRGGVAHMFCDITYPDGSVFDGDTRALLKKTVEESAARGISFQLGTEIEFYLFKQDENGESTLEPIDTAGYMDIAAEDKGENVRREICLTLEQMGIHPEGTERNRLPLRPRSHRGGQCRHLQGRGKDHRAAVRSHRRFLSPAPDQPGRQRHAHQPLRFLPGYGGHHPAHGGGDPFEDPGHDPVFKPRGELLRPSGV